MSQLGWEVSVSCWGWSDESEEAARAKARDKLPKLMARASTGQPLPHRYGYPDRPLRELIVREVKNGAGETVAVITRNSYGCLVLNTARVVFLDVDIPALENVSSEKPGFMGRLLGWKSAGQLTEPVLEKARSWSDGNSGWGWRAYRTRAGIRLLATHAPISPDDVEASGLHEHMGVDPLYRRLCKNQQSYRARLTPKPWRCGQPTPPNRWPWKDRVAEQGFLKWESDYLKHAGTWATCELLAKLGSETVHPEIAPTLQLHDEISRVGSGLDLA